jgi:uncharacterized cupredoxin-like copper-binding protein
MLNEENEIQNWGPVLEHADAPPIKDNYRKAVTAKLLENTEIAMREQAQASTFGTLSEDANTNTGSTGGAAGGIDPVLISLVRRAMPYLIAYDVAGVQPMSGPTGLIFAMKARYAVGAVTTADVEALNAEALTDFSGTGTHANSADHASATTGTGLTTAASESAGSTPGTDDLGEMGFTIEKATVTAKTRQLKAEYSMELAQDLKAVHGLDAESELANILSGEILAEINREVIRSIVATGVGGCAAGTATVGTFDLVADADGRWAVEKFQSLIFQIEQEANAIATATRRGKGNFVICSSNVASALAAAGKLTFAGEGELNVDGTGNTFAGTLNGRLKVYVDPYAVTDYATVGYKGSSPYDAGLFYCPYVPLTMVRAIGENSFQPKIAFKTRYGLVANPLVAANPQSDIGGVNTNPYYRTFSVTSINVGLQS